MENRELITKAIRYIQENPKENLALETIADNAGFSLAYFDTLFRQHTGYSAVEYSRVYKLTRAAYMLRWKPETTVLDIALEYGYASPETFARAFRAFYGMSPTEYREKFSDEMLGWKALSSRVSIGRFARAFPEMKPVSSDTVVDLAFTHNPWLYFEDLIEFDVRDTEAFTLGDPENPRGVVIVSDYDEAEPFLNLICPEEADAVRYLQRLAKLGNCRFELHKEPTEVWEALDRAAASEGFVCRRSLDMIYPEKAVDIPEVPGYAVRELTADDLPLVADFQRQGGCGPQDLRGLEMHFQGKGNPGERGFGLFRNGVLIGLMTPVLDVVRDLGKYDFGAVFTVNGTDPDAALLLWKAVIFACVKDGCVFGAAGAKDEEIELCRKLGMAPVAECCVYERM